jgi:hypothetical protein
MKRLSIVRDGKLVGIVTTKGMLTSAGRLFENALRVGDDQHGRGGSLDPPS